jgi:hypothetical protein
MSPSASGPDFGVVTRLVVVFREEMWSWSGGREGFESPRALIVIAVTVYRYDRTRSIRY